MISLKGVLAIIIGSYAFVLFCLWRDSSNDQIEINTSQFHQRLLPTTSVSTSSGSSYTELLGNDEEAEDGVYRFINPALAFKVLTNLDVYQPMTDAQIRRYNFNPHYNQAIFGFKADNQYCEKHRANFVVHPESVFTELNSLASRSNASFVRTHVLPNYGHSMHPDNNYWMPKDKRDKQITDIDPSVNNYFTPLWMFANLHIGQQFSCLSQMSNHIPGSAKLHSKELFAEAATLYLKKYETRPQCLSYDKFFPKSFLLSHKDQCQTFFAILNSEEYKKLKEEKSILYIKKISGYHKGEGIAPLNDVEEKKIRDMYDNGRKCGHIKTQVIMQHYVPNPLLLNGNKFDFRMYMLVASANPVIAYYHDGFLRVSLMEYDVTSDDKKNLLTNLSLNKKIYEDAQNGKLYNGMDTEALRNAQQWTLERLQEYLLSINRITDKNWLDNYLRPEFKKAMAHIVKLSFTDYLENSSLYEVYGVDFMLDDDLNLWYIEANWDPAYDNKSKPLAKFVLKMLRDHYEVVTGLLRSRMKRVVQFVNTLTKNGSAYIGPDGKLVLENLKENQEVFKQITKNYFEKEYEISSENGFSKIVDGNYEGEERYQGYIAKECL